MEEDDLESTVESIISAIAYAFESIWRWDCAVGVGEVVNLLVWGKVRIGNNTRLRGYSSRLSFWRAFVCICWWRRERKLNFVLMCCPSLAVVFCVCAARTEMIYHSAWVPHLNLFQKRSITACKYRIEIYFVLSHAWMSVVCLHQAPLIMKTMFGIPRSKLNI